MTTDIKWKKDGGLVSPRASISQQEGDKRILSIENVEEVDSGDYSCEASNVAGIVSRSTVEITVKLYAPNEKSQGIFHYT